MWTVTSYLKPLLLPPMGLVLLALAGWLLRPWRPRLARFVMATAVVVLYLLGTPFVANLLLRTLEADPPLAASRYADDVGAIVVVGADVRPRAPEYGGATVGRLTMERLRYGAWLQRATGKPLLASGGRVGGAGLPLARVMREVLAGEFGAQPVWVEELSRNTYENARFSAAILRREGIGKVYLVTQGWHMARARGAFEAAGIEVVAAPTGLTAAPAPAPRNFLATGGALQASTYAVHEWLGRLWYRLAYY